MLRKISETIMFLLCLAGMGGTFVSCDHGRIYTEMTGSVWNTAYNIKYNGDPALEDSVTAIMREVEMSLSPFNSQSVISRINRNESDSVDGRVNYIFHMSREVNRQSRGAFDPTLSPLINLWGFGYEKSEEPEPSPAEITEALLIVGIDSCSIEDGRMIKKHPLTTFNFSAITKGYGCDEIARMFRRNGVDDYMIEIGGEIALGGVNDRGKPWRIMIETPRDGLVRDSNGLTTVMLTNCGIATSGNYRNYHETSRGRVGHTISPVTGYPIRTSTLSATVIAPTCAQADALATACMAMPTDSALSMISAIDSVDCLLIVSSPADSALTLLTTPRFNR